VSAEYQKIRCDILGQMRGTPSGLPLRAALKRGALVTAANWPVVLIRFVMIAMYRVSVGVPVVGGAFVVAVLAGADIRTLLASDLQAAGGLVIAALAGRPADLAVFLLAVGVVAVGGGVLVFLMHAGTAGILVQGERQAGDVHRAPLRLSAVWRANAFGIAEFQAGVRRFGRRFVILGLWLTVAYAGVGGFAVGGLLVLAAVGGEQGGPAVWGLGVLLVTSGVLIAVAGLNLVYALLQVIIVTDGCRVSQAVGRLHAFVTHDARQVAGVFGVVLALVVLASAASLLATAGLALVAWVPFVGLAVVPLQLAAWLMRGVVFHYMELGAWSAYQSQYRRYADPASGEDVSAWGVRA